MDNNQKYTNENNDKLIIDSLTSKLNDVIRQRDHARKLYCYVMANPGKNYYYYANEAAVAKEQGWDCCDPKRQELYLNSPSNIVFRWNFVKKDWEIA